MVCKDRVLLTLKSINVMSLSSLFRFQQNFQSLILNSSVKENQGREAWALLRQSYLSKKGIMTPSAMKPLTSAPSPYYWSLIVFLSITYIASFVIFVLDVYQSISMWVRWST